MIKILYFGMIAEAMGKSEIEIELSFNNIAGLKQYMLTINPNISKYSFKFAVNNDLIEDNYIIKNGDVIAVLPPFAGG